MKIPSISILFAALAMSAAFAQAPSPTPAPTPIRYLAPKGEPKDENVVDGRAQWMKEAENLPGATIIEGDTQLGDLSYFDRDVVLRGNVSGAVSQVRGQLFVVGTVNGPISVMGGTLTVLGTVNGAVSVVGGDLRVAGTVRGTASVIGGRILRTPDAEMPVSVSAVAVPGFSGPVPSWMNLEFDPDFRDVFFSPFWILPKALLLVVWLVLGLLLAIIWPENLAETAAALAREPLRHGAAGLLFWIAFWLLMLCAVAGSFFFVGIPFVLLLAVIYVALKWYGFAVVFTWIGRTLGRRFRGTEPGVVAAVAIGAAVAGVIRMIPLLGFAFWQLLGWLAAGAAVLGLARHFAKRKLATPGVTPAGELPPPVG